MKSIFCIVQFLLLINLYAEQILHVNYYTEKDYVPHVLLQNTDGFVEGLDIITTQDKVRLYIFDEDNGLLPYRINFLRAGVYRIRLEKTGYNPLETSVEVIPGKRTEVFAVLEKEYSEPPPILQDNPEKSGSSVELAGEVLRIFPRNISLKREEMLTLSVKIGSIRRDSLSVYMDGTLIYQENEPESDSLTLFPDISQLSDGEHTVQLEYSQEGTIEKTDRTFNVTNTYPRRPDNPVSSYSSVNGPQFSGEVGSTFHWLYNSISNEHLFPVNVRFRFSPLEGLKFSLEGTFYLDPRGGSHGIAPGASVFYTFLASQKHPFRGSAKLQYRYWGYTSGFTKTRTDLGMDDLPAFVISSPWSVDFHFLRLNLEPCFQILTADNMGQAMSDSFKSALLHIILKTGFSLEFSFLQSGFEYAFMTPSLNSPAGDWRHSISVWITGIIPQSGFTLSVLYNSELNSTNTLLNQRAGLQFGFKF